MVKGNVKNQQVQKPRAGLSFRHYMLIVIALMALAASLELAMGRHPLSLSGRILLWVSDVNSSENSQQLADWYSFTHIIHGIALFAIVRLIGRGKWPLGLCLVAAVFLECSWEVLENSSFIINRYRQTMAQGYYGDSILNSMSDISFAMFGFFLASRLPIWATIGLVIVIEAGLAWGIHDNLTLNIIMLIHPFAGIKHWQMGV